MLLMFAWFVFLPQFSNDKRGIKGRLSFQAVLVVTISTKALQRIKDIQGIQEERYFWG